MGSDREVHIASAGSSTGFIVLHPSLLQSGLHRVSKSLLSHTFTSEFQYNGNVKSCA